MPRISQILPGLINGVSQQAPSVRLDSQGEIQDNAMSDLVKGLTKRPNSQHVAYLGNINSISSNAFVHTISRGDNEDYIVVFLDNDIKVFDLQGNPKTVQFPSGKAYLNTNSPQQDLRVVTVADSTFVVNRLITVASTVVTSGTLSGTKQTFEKLEPSAAFGEYWQITGDPNNNFDSYYVVRGNGVWIETNHPSFGRALTSSTMPHRLVRMASGVFSWEPITWASREVGDNESSPVPSFVGQKITDIAFYRNRLVLAAGQNVVLSRSGSFFNFWRQSVLNVLDDDPIDVEVANAKVSNIHAIVAYNKQLLLFSGETQFSLNSTDTLTPSTVKIDVSTNFDVSTLCHPVALGANVYFPTNTSRYAALREYYTEQNAVTDNAANITSHIPSYIPNSIIKITGSGTSEMLFCLSSGARNVLYVYKYFFQGNEKKQSSWSRWSFASGDFILGCEVIDTTLYLLVRRSDGVFLDKIDFQPNFLNDVGYRVSLDRLTPVTGSYSVATGYTTWSMPYDSPSVAMQVVLGASFGADAGATLALTRTGSGTFRALGNWSGGSVYAGIPYTMTYRLSQLYVHTGGGNSVLSNRVMVRELLANYVDTGEFDIVVSATGRPTYTYPYQGRVLGTGDIVLGKPQVTDGASRVPVMLDSRDAILEIRNPYPVPCSIQSLEWTGSYNQVNQPIS